MNARAKEISLKQLITVFRHPVADLNIAINECLKVAREELNLKFTPVDKQNPRIVVSRLEVRPAPPRSSTNSWASSSWRRGRWTSGRSWPC